MSKNKLTEQLFDILKDSNQNNDIQIHALSENIANSVTALTKELTPETAQGYKTQIETLNQEILNFKEEKLGKILGVIKDNLPQNTSIDVKEILEMPLVEYQATQEASKRQAEISSPNKINPASPEFKPIIDLNRDRGVAQQNDFVQKGKKAAGVSAGYVAQEQATDKTFMLKQFYKEDHSKLTGQQRADRRDAVRELIGGDMYERLLYNRAPKEALVTPPPPKKEAQTQQEELEEAEKQKVLYVRSKFLDKVEPLYGVMDQAAVTPLKGDKKLEGFEKAIAACHLMGESDYHGNNLMVQDNKTIIKIDHGRSFMDFPKNFHEMITTTNQKFQSYGYDADMNAGNLSFNVKKYSAALNQMIQQLDDKQIDSIIDQKMDELTKNGFNPNGIKLDKRYPDGSIGEIKIDNEKELREFYKDSIKNNLANMKEVAKKVDIVAKFSNFPSIMENGKWIKAFANSGIQDPVVFAAQKDIQIEGKNALQWAHENNYKMELPDTIIPEKVKEQQWTKNPQGKWEEKTIEVTRDKIVLKSIDPLTYVSLLNRKNNKEPSKSEKEFYTQAKALKLLDANGQLYDTRPEYRDPKVINEMYKQDEVVGKKLENLAKDFEKNNAQGEVTTEKVAELYDKTLEELKNEKLLTDQDIAIIKGDKSFQKKIENTAKLMNDEGIKVTRTDKAYYRIAKFCNKIGFTGIGYNLEQRILPESLKKIHAIEDVQNMTANIKKPLIKARGKEGVQTKRLEKINAKFNINLRGNKGASR